MYGRLFIAAAAYQNPPPEGWPGPLMERVLAGFLVDFRHLPAHTTRP